MKNHANMAAAHSPPIPVAAATPRTRNRRTGMSGAAKHAQAAASRADEAVDAHRLGAVRGFAEEIHDERQRDRRDHRAAEPLYRPRGDQYALRRRDPAGERGDGEERHTEQEQAPL